MAQSAGLRKTRPVIRFEDYHASLGSKETLDVAQRKIAEHLFKCREENGFVSKLAENECCSYALSRTLAHLRSDIPINALRKAYWNGFFVLPKKSKDLAGVSWAAL